MIAITWPLTQSGANPTTWSTQGLSYQASASALYLKVVLRQRANPNPANLAATPGLSATARSFQEVLAKASYLLTTPLGELHVSDLLAAKAWSKFAEKLPNLVGLASALDRALVSGSPESTVRSVITALEDLAALFVSPALAVYTHLLEEQ